MERLLYIDFDKSRLITSVVSDIGYWLVNYTGDDVGDVFDVEKKTQKYQHISHAQDHIAVPPQIDRIQKILNNKQIFFEDSIGEAGEPEDMKDDLMDLAFLEQNEVDEVLSNGPEIHPDSSYDITYTLLPKRIPRSTQKISLNEK